MSYSITEAFKRLDMLDEAFFNEADEEDMEELSDLVKSDFQKADDATKVIDNDAETEADVVDVHEDNIVIECPVCKNKFFKKEDELEYDEDSNLVNVGEDCTCCMSNDGFEIVGRVEPFVPDNTEVKVDGEEVDVEPADDEDDDDEEVDVEPADDEDDDDDDDDEDIDESCEKNKLKEALDDDIDDFDPYDSVPYYGEEEGKADNIIDDDEDIDDVDFDFDDEEDAVDADDDWDIEGSYARGNGKWRVFIDGEDTELHFNSEEDAREHVSNWRGEDRDNGEHHKYEIRLVESTKLIRPRKLTLDESFDEVSIKTDDSEMEMTQDPETQEVTVKSRPRQAIAGEEMITPMEDDEMDDLMGVETEDEFPEDDLMGEEDFSEEPIEDEDEFVPDEEIPDEEIPEEDEDRLDTASYHIDHKDVDVIMEDFDDAGFDYLGESFFKKVYNNVDSFKTVNVRARDNSLIVEGLIDFKSGNQKKTSFIMESDSISRSGLLTFKGINNPIKHGKKSFTLTGRVNGKKLMCESLRWHYKQKDEDGIVRRIYGSSVRNK